MLLRAHSRTPREMLGICLCCQPLIQKKIFVGDWNLNLVLSAQLKQRMQLAARLGCTRYRQILEI